MKRAQKCKHKHLILLVWILKNNSGIADTYFSCVGIVWFSGGMKIKWSHFVINRLGLEVICSKNSDYYGLVWETIPWKLSEVTERIKLHTFLILPSLQQHKKHLIKPSVIKKCQILHSIELGNDCNKKVVAIWEQH